MRGPLLAALLLLALPAAARGATLETIDVPSRVVDPAAVDFNPGGALKATVMLPDGYDAGRAYRLLVLLHGVGDTHAGWASERKGRILQTADGLDAIVVMPEGAKGFYTDWFDGGPAWETYLLDELLPLVLRRYRILPGREHHAIAGVSMGGLGAALLAGRRPGFFGSVAVLSGFVDHQRREVSEGGMQLVAGTDYHRVFGPVDGPYATGRNPTRTAGNLAQTRTYVVTGDGATDRSMEPSPPQTAAVAAPAEGLIVLPQVEAFVAALRRAGVAHTYRRSGGTHDWPTFREGLRRAIAWGLFDEAAAGTRRRWTHVTVGRRGEVHGVGYEMTARPSSLLRLVRDGEVLHLSGPAQEVVLTERGCTLRAVPPATVVLPRRPCGRLDLRVEPARVPVGRTVTVRVATGSEGAVVRIGRTRAVADAGGVAHLRVRIRRPARVRVAALDGRRGRAPLRVSRICSRC